MTCGGPDYCRETLEELASTYDINEISVVNVTHNFEPEIRNYYLLASGFDLS
ncbi:hypothetical protein LCGC14_3017000 [marine sediment metagenome]|uniref:Uncharacterized protein n=1 Tax=marine sediment metagenome TaxID=412755 RepID=A0A0F8XJA9_9ZZZZ